MPGRRAKEKLTPEEQEKRHNRESLERSKRRIQGELSKTTSEVRRTALENALKYLNEEIERS